ncbi:hypothetical protein MMC16_004132 [Acarospora aff. strigata]|nr:hypothetical protein [Acarospora aff. strigata]
MRRLEAYNKPVQRVFLETLFVDEFRAWSNVKEELEKTAEEVGIRLHTRLSEDKDDILQKYGGEFKRTKRRRSIRTTDDGVLGNVAYESEEEQLVCETPAKTQIYLPTPSPTPHKGMEFHHQSNRNQDSPLPVKRKRRKTDPAIPQGMHQQSQTADLAPKTKLGFRMYDDNSSGVNGPAGFRAGLFSDCNGEVSSPPDIGSKAFYNAAKNHFNWVREPTPFISMYQGLLPVLHRGFQSVANASVAVIDLQAVSASSKLYVAAQVIKQLGLRHGSFQYRGISEWLVWGMIDRNAVITTFKIKDLRKFLNGAPDVRIVLRFPEIENSRDANSYRKSLKGNLNQVGKACGRVVGKFTAFMAVPDSYVEEVARKIVRNWQLIGCRSPHRMEAYLAGVQLGLSQARTAPRLSKREGSKTSLTQYLERVVGQEHTGADIIISRPKPKPCLGTYLELVSKGRCTQAEVPIREPKPRLASFLEKVSSQEHTSSNDVFSRPKRRLRRYLEKVSEINRTADVEASHQIPKPDDSLTRRKHIDATWS